eukprot:scaffold3604_cov275-Pinguiococcus_pyrenoidosus.AAC.7
MEGRIEDVNDILFDCMSELRRRCKKRGLYPRHAAKSNGLKVLLRVLYPKAQGDENDSESESEHDSSPDES